MNVISASKNTRRDHRVEMVLDLLTRWQKQNTSTELLVITNITGSQYISGNGVPATGADEIPPVTCQNVFGAWSNKV